MRVMIGKEEELKFISVNGTEYELKTPKRWNAHNVRDDGFPYECFQARPDNLRYIEMLYPAGPDRKIIKWPVVEDLEYFEESLERGGLSFVSFNEHIFLCKPSLPISRPLSRPPFGSISFDHAYFLEKVHFSGPLKNASFRQAVFEKEASFVGAQFGSADFSGIQFKQKVSFLNATFEGKANFGRVDRRDEKSPGAQFEGGADFTQAQFKSVADFSNAKSSKNSEEEFSFNYAHFQDVAYFSGAKLQNATFKYAIVEREIQFLGADIEAQDRETYQLIKHELLRLNNRIEALRYHALEMEKHREEFLTRGLKRFLEMDYWILRLNERSNGHGLRPLRGVGFVFAVGLFFYLLYEFLAGWRFIVPSFVWWSHHFSWDVAWFRLESVMKDALEFITPLDFFKEDLIKNLQKASVFAMSAFILGKLLLVYGYYQTIQAFRKFTRDLG